MTLGVTALPISLSSPSLSNYTACQLACEKNSTCEATAFDHRNSACYGGAESLIPGKLTNEGRCSVHSYM